jgi:hypothetical protein
VAISSAKSTAAQFQIATGIESGFFSLSFLTADLSEEALSKSEPFTNLLL